MTVALSSSKIIYTGNGSTTQWSIPFAYLSADDLSVSVLDADGQSQLLTNNYTVNTSTHVLTYPIDGSGLSPLSADEKIMIRRVTPLTQQTHFAAQAVLDPSVLEKGYDKAILIAQELTEKMQRCIKYPPTTSSFTEDIDDYLAYIDQGVATCQSALTQAGEVKSELEGMVPDISGKAEKDLSNLTTAGKRVASGLGMPSTRFSNLTLGDSGDSYTAPANGWVYVSKKASAASQYLAIIKTFNEVNSYESDVMWSGTANQSLYAHAPIRRGESFKVNFSVGGDTNYFRFMYAQGDE